MKATAASACRGPTAGGEGLRRHAGGVGVHAAVGAGEATRRALDVLEAVQPCPAAAARRRAGPRRRCRTQGVARHEQRLDGEGGGVGVADAAGVAIDRAAEATVGALLVEEAAARPRR